MDQVQEPSIQTPNPAPPAQNAETSQPQGTPPPPTPKSFLGLPLFVLAILGILLLAGSVGAAYFFVMQPKEVACTLEAKICPDGTSVGRAGPKCEFAPCPTAEPTPDPTANWKTHPSGTYTNNQYRYTLEVPVASILTEYDSDFVEIDYQISIIVSNSNPEDCRGDCPFNESVSNTKVGEYNARSILGNIGGIGGAIPQSFKSIVIKHNNLYYVFTLYELKNDPNAPIDYQDRKPGKIPQDKLVLFDQILSTFKFTDSNPTPTCMKRPACLDSEPQCLIPEPANGWCP